ncbi:MAG: T9SS type A sorting domain-containing protein [Bacteroidetes bacterium]|nr:T9SS type A sorting domain-containing protein [Bacteroidota bacterium]
MRKIFLLLLVGMFFTNSLYSQLTWLPVNNAPTELRIEDVSFINDTTGFLEANDTIYKTTNAGLTWNMSGTFPAAYVRSIEFINDSVGFIGTLQQNPTPAGIFKTEDGGATWTNINSLLTSRPAWGICGIAHYNNSIVAVGSVITESNLYYSHNAGASWTHINLSSLANALIDVYMFDSLTWLVTGKSDTGTGQKATILRTTDGGATWARVALASAPNTYCWKLYFQPNGIGYGSIEDFTSAALFKTVDDGITWQEIIVTGITQSDVGAVAGINDTTIWLGIQHNVGYLESNNGGASWIYMNYGLNMNRMFIPPGGSPICVGSTVYKYGLLSGFLPEATFGDAHEISLYPNPSKDVIHLKIDLSTATPLYIIITDLKGKLIHLLDHSYHPSGEIDYRVDVNDYATGTYVAIVISNQQNFGKKFEVIK